MSEFKVSARAYTKMIFHAAKYPHCAVNGILLGEKPNSENKKVNIVDAIPLFHQCLYVTPMAEVALQQLEAYAKHHDLQIAGYYCAPENFYDVSLDKCPGVKIAEKINDNYPNAGLVMIDNKLIASTQDKGAIRVFQNTDNKWSKAAFELEHSAATLDAVLVLLKRGAMKEIYDFDNHLDNPEISFENKHLNKDLTQIMAMF